MSRQWTPADLDDALRALAGSIDGAAPPDYAERVTRQLAERPTAPPVRAVALRRRAILLAAAVVVAFGLLSVPATRHAMASWFSFGGVSIEYAPSTSPLPTPTDPPTLNAGVPITMRTAREDTAGRLVLAGGLPTPETFLLHEGDGVAITLAYRQVPGLHPTAETGHALIVTEVFDAGRPLYRKILLTGASARFVTVNGHRGVYIEGPQELVAGNPTSAVYTVEARMSANTLIWSDGDATFRLEADVNQATALRLAELLR